MKTLTAIALVLTIAVAPANAIPSVIYESMRTYCEVQPMEYGACMKDQIQGYAEVQLRRNEAYAALEVECAAKYPAKGQDYYLCKNVPMSCNLEGCKKS